MIIHLSSHGKFVSMQMNRLNMDITYLGHSCFKIKTSSISLICDPFDPKEVGLKLPSQEADIVTVSHHHGDHDNVEVVKNARKIIDGPGEYEIGGVSIMGYNTYHDGENGEKRGRNTIYLIEVGGVRILHLGDLGHSLSDKLVEEIGEVNILMINAGHPMALSASEATKVVHTIEPQIVLPMHFVQGGTNPAFSEKLEPVEPFLKELGLTVEKLPKLSIKLSDLGEEQKIILLEKK